MKKKMQVGPVEIERDAFMGAAHFVAPVTVKRSTIPILAATLIDVRDGAVHLTATSLDVTLRAHAEAATPSLFRIGAIARDLSLALDVFGAGPILMSVDDDSRLVLTQGVTTIRLDGYPFEDFPTMPPEPNGGAAIPSTALRGLVRDVAYAVTAEETRFQLHGALLEAADKQLMAVATDGHRMAVSRYPRAAKGVPTKAAFIPTWALAEIPSLDGGVLVYGKSDDGTNLYVAGATRSVSWRAIDVNFPNYQGVIPDDCPNVVAVNVRDFAKALACVLPFVCARTATCSFDFGADVLTISAFDLDRGSASTALPVTRRAGGPVRIYWNAGYVRQFLDVIQDCEEVTIEVPAPDKNGDFGASLFRPTGRDLRYVVMPVRRT